MTGDSLGGRPFCTPRGPIATGRPVFLRSEHLPASPRQTEPGRPTLSASETGEPMGPVVVELSGMHELRAEASVYRSLGLAVLALFAPIFAVLYWLMIPSGTWLWVASAHLAITFVCGIALFGACRAYVRVGGAGFSERSIGGHVSTVAVTDVGSVIMMDLYRSDALDTEPQLFVIGQSGERLMRMRGQFWTQDAMECVADELGVPVLRVPEPLTLSELNLWKPELLHWFERRLVLRCAA